MSVIEKLKCPTGFVLIGTDNNGNRHRYSIEKNECFKDIFVKFMVDLGFEEEKIRHTFTAHLEDEETREDIELKISEFEDCCRYYENNKYEVDVFYGSKKIILVIRTKNRDELLDNLESKSKWKKFPKLIKLKEKKSEPGQLVVVNSK